MSWRSRLEEMPSEQLRSRFDEIEDDISELRSEQSAIEKALGVVEKRELITSFSSWRDDVVDLLERAQAEYLTGAEIGALEELLVAPTKAIAGACASHTEQSRKEAGSGMMTTIRRISRRVICALVGHRWDGPFMDYGDMPAGVRGCRRCRVWNYDLCSPRAQVLRRGGADL